VRGWAELSLGAQRIAFDRAARLGFFAPRRAVVAEAAAFVERESARGVALTLDLGAGAQRVDEFGAPAPAGGRAPPEPGRSCWCRRGRGARCARVRRLRRRNRARGRQHGALALDGRLARDALGALSVARRRPRRAAPWGGSFSPA
jgi:hypothetical protein